MARIKPQALLQQSKKKKGPANSNRGYYNYPVRCDISGYGVFPVCYLRTLVPRDDKAFSDLNKLQNPRYAVINTSKGYITVELYKEGSSEVADFIDACKKGIFKGMPFNRVIKNFVIQGGDVERADAKDDWTTRGKHYSQLDTSLKHEAFMLGTSKAKDETAGFDLFITTAPIPDLNEKINVFGRVIKGEDVVQEIEEVDTDDHYKPKAPMAIIDVVLKQKV